MLVVVVGGGGGGGSTSKWASVLALLRSPPRAPRVSGSLVLLPLKQGNGCARTNREVKEEELSLTMVDVCVHVRARVRACVCARVCDSR